MYVQNGKRPCRALQDESGAAEGFAGVLCNFLPENMPERPTDLELEPSESGYQVAQVHPLPHCLCAFFQHQPCTDPDLSATCSVPSSNPNLACEAVMVTLFCRARQTLLGLHA